MALLSSRVTQIFLSLGILVLLLVYLISGTPALMRNQVAQLNTAADTYLYEGKSWQYSPSGELNHLLRADALFHFKNMTISTLEKPRLSIFEAGQLAWTASAVEGNIAHETQTIELQNSVVLNNEQKQTRLTTASMTIIPANKTALSNQHTLIVDSGSRIEAQAMRADLSSNVVTMQSRVKGYYAKP